jgi:hypothetical protein
MPAKLSRADFAAALRRAGLAVKGRVRRFSYQTESPSWIVRSCLCLVLVIPAFLLTASCAEAAGYNRLGAGTASCGIWTAFRQEGTTSARALSAEQWLLGFIDGITEASGGAADPLSGMDAEHVWDWIDSYCHANPTKSIADAGSAFIAAHPH